MNLIQNIKVISSAKFGIKTMDLSRTYLFLYPERLKRITSKKHKIEFF